MFDSSEVSAASVALTMRRTAFGVLLALAFLTSSRAHAGDAGESGAGTEDGQTAAREGSTKSRLTEDHWYLAAGPVGAPDYEGSDDYDVNPLIIARWTRGGAYVELEGNTVTANLIPASLFQAGPAIRWHRDRDDVSDDRVERMREVDGALEAGGFFGVMLRDPEAPRRRIGLRLRVLQDVSGSHDGYEAKLTLDGGLPLSDTWALNLQVFSHYASGSYMDTFFSVDADNATRSGLRQFDAEAGFKNFGADLMLSYQISDHWGVGLIAGYKRLLGDAADSPVTDDAGSPNQFVGAVVATWRN